jgi:hypothetical protein
MSQPDAIVTSWRKSSRCESQHCLEVAGLAEGLAVRNSTDPTRVLVFARPAWRKFLANLSAGS